MKLNREQITELFGSAPEDQDGKKLVGMERRYPKKGEPYFSDSGYGWSKAHADFECETYMVAIFETIAQPTTLADLVGEDGQTTAYLHYTDEIAETITLETDRNKLYMVNGDDVPTHIEHHRRWSHNPTTRWEDANEFEGGANE